MWYGGGVGKIQKKKKKIMQAKMPEKKFFQAETEEKKNSYRKKF